MGTNAPPSPSRAHVHAITAAVASFLSESTPAHVLPCSVLWARRPVDTALGRTRDPAAKAPGTRLPGSYPPVRIHHECTARTTRAVRVPCACRAGTWTPRWRLWSVPSGWKTQSAQTPAGTTPMATANRVHPLRRVPAQPHGGAAAAILSSLLPAARSFLGVRPICPCRTAPYEPILDPRAS